MTPVEKTVGGTLHFAYGSNMDADQMDKRCVDHVFVGPARLDEYRFFITARGYATVVPAVGGVVRGVLWRLSGDDERALDRYEGVAQGLYTRMRLSVTRVDNSRVEALVYVATSREPGTPKKGYLEQIVASAIARGLPREYIDQLKSWGRAKE